MGWVVSAAIVGSSIIGGVISSKASDKAAKAQSSASESATDAQIQAAQISADAMKDASAQSASATRYAANASASAAREGIQAQLEMYYKAVAMNKPYTDAGKWALGRLKKMTAAGPGEFEESPGYKLRLDQGNDNILSNASATGGLASGRTLKALQEYGQDYASNEYQNFLGNYYQSLAPYQYLTGLGQNAAANTGNAGISTAQGMQSGYNSMANNYSNMGNQLSANYSNLGQGLANNAMQSGNAAAANYINQGNISAQNSIAQSNAWTGAMNNGMTGLGMYYGNGGGGGGFPSFGSFGQQTIAPYQSGGASQTPGWNVS